MQINRVGGCLQTSGAEISRIYRAIWVRTPAAAADLRYPEYAIVVGQNSGRFPWADLSIYEQVNLIRSRADDTAPQKSPFVDRSL